MKSRDAVLKARQFEADEKRRKVEDLERMIGEFNAMAAELDREIEAEESRTGIREYSHVSYSTLASAAARRRDNLRLSAREFGARLEIARAERDDAVSELARAEQRRSREGERGGRTIAGLDGTRALPLLARFSNS